ncbi:MAG TPA: LysM peptidoglycan-binding domain-containing protein [Alphaproteobacteria bacterium]
MLNRNVIIGLVGAGLLAIGAVSAWITLQQQDRDEDRPRAVSPPVASRPQAQPQQAPSSQAALPSFDVVRINPAGDAVMAGRAAPNATVHILDGEQEIGTVTADSRGEWVFVPKDPLPSGSRELSLTARVGDQDVRSDQVVVLAVPDRAGKPNEELPLVVSTSRSGQGVSRVLQGPGRAGDGARLSLDVVGVDAGGALALSGHAPPNTTIQAYLDNRLLGRAVAGADGRWQLTPAEHAPLGTATLRLDQLADDGRVVMRVELPFARTEDLVAGGGGLGATDVTVKSGDSLWRIARRTQGRGMAYLTIYQANRDQIRDPDLIYPGQVFHVTRVN